MGVSKIMSVLVTLLICLVSIQVGCSEASKSRIVNINQGPVRGYKSSEGNYFVFYGIPYATAPKGTQRFQAPLPPSTWVKPFEAFDKGVVCPQFNYPVFVPKNKQMQEDCLIANIYVPDTEEWNLPVLVYVHGGAYLFGFGNMVTPRNLMNSGKVVIVTFNYRLGVTGFLCLGTKDVPGNAGMKDQVALLRWVKNNIANFGGNPDDVTISGYSAGASSVDLLMISKITKNLFNKVIPESGSNLSPFSVQTDPIESAKTFAKMLNFTEVDNFYALEDFYKTAPLNLLISISVFDRIDIPFVFTPCVERDTGVERFLDNDPMHILMNGDYPKLPMLYGFTSKEGLIRIPQYDTWKKRMNKHFSDYLPGDLTFASKKEKERIAAKVKEFYFGSSPVSERTLLLGFVDYYSDITFIYSALKSVNLQVKAGNHQVYLYEYTYKNATTSFIPFIDVEGATHCAQTFAVLDEFGAVQADESRLSDDYRSMKKTMREIWLNFVMTGQPISDGSPLPEWPPTGPDHVPYMTLDKNLELQHSPPLHDRYLFWKEIYDQYYCYPVPPPTPPPKGRVEL